MDRGEVLRVTIGVRGLARARGPYSGLPGMREVGEWGGGRRRYLGGSTTFGATVCALADLGPGSIREHRPAGGSPRVALANVAGEVFGSRGELRGRTLACPWHAWMIDVPTGEVKGGRGASIRPRAVRVRSGMVELAAPRGGRA